MPVETAVEVAGGDDSHSEGLVLLGLEAAVEDGLADEPGGDEVAAVEGVVEECGEFEEGVGEEVGLVEDEDGLDVLLVDQVEHGALDVLPELAAAVVRAQAELAYFAT